MSSSTSVSYTHLDVYKRQVYKYVKDPAFVEKARRLVREGRETTSFGCGYDLRWNPRRFAYYLVHMQRYFKKFKTYYK